MNIDRKELIQKYIEFFKSKGHSEIKNSSLVPENDPTVLFTTAGMHPLVPFLLGEPHPQGKRLCNVQRCIRTGDIDEVGDTCHHTMFEMLGNWSVGDYFKKEAIEYSFEFLTQVLKIPLERFAVTVFAGDADAPKDNEAAEIWKKLGVSEKRIAFMPKSDNWWGPAGKTGPCGPDTEMFYWKPNNKKAPAVFDPADKNWVEIWNDVLMQYTKESDGRYHEAKQKNIDTGMGVERTVTILNGLEDNYEADMWKPIIEEIEDITAKDYKGNEREMRIIADHIKAATFIIADGIVPGNSEQGYVLRRLIRRAIRSLKKLGLDGDFMTWEIGRKVTEIYNDYDPITKNKEKILSELKKEEEQFEKTLDKGLREFEKMSNNKKIDGKSSFLLYQSYGFPIEMIRELASEKGISIDEEGFKTEFEKHQELSRTATAGKFKSGLADNSEATKKLHTACHLLNEALRVVLDKPDLHQKGSNITPERLRFDFNFDRKLTDEELEEVEELVNLKIQANIPVICKVMPLKEAKSSGAKGVFDSKYEENVKVYSIGSIGEEFSKEICAGPHVNNTSELGHFKIVKEESSSAGVRRIKAVLE
jgi:alanyl-tRNA synthetase